MERSSDSRKRAIRKFVKSKVVQEAGVLYYRCEEESKRQWIADPDQQKQILASVHDDPAGGCHFGRDKTRDKVCKRYHWHNVVEEIDALVHTCEQCQKVGKLWNFVAFSLLFLFVDISNLWSESVVTVLLHIVQANPKFSKGVSTLKPIPIKDVWHRIGIDLIGPLPTTANGRKC